MAKFYGAIGYMITSETAPGVWGETIKERSYFGDVLRLSKRDQTADKLNDDIVLNHKISIVADQHAYENFYNIKYVKWAGAKWKVTDVEVEHPRLILTTGGVYNGP